MNNQIKIVKRDYGIADRFSDGTIEINKNLDDYPKLKKAILDHELGHTTNKEFNKSDFVHDLNSTKDIDKKELLRFMIKHPKSLTQFLPINYSKKRGLIIDVNMSIAYIIIVTIISFGILIGTSIWNYI